MQALGTAISLVALALIGCQRVPEEPSKPAAPPTSERSAPSTASTGPVAAVTTLAASATTAPAAPAASTEGHDRCVDPLADKPPPAPPPGPAPGCPADPERKPKLARASVSVGPSAKVSAEIARTEADVTRGLMYRTSMGEEEGMLFRLDSRRVHAFWMHNTCIPLDMLFVDEDGTIVGVVENVPTLNDQERRVRCPSLYVLEVNAGWVRRHGVRPGQKLAIPDGAR